jgi:hypothetical protein
MYSERYKDIEPITQKMFQLIREGDIEGARIQKEKLIELFKREIEWISKEVLKDKSNL